MKVCTLDCVYCQLGRTTEKSTVRRKFVDIRAVVAEVEARLREGVRVDHVTLGGSGEPTLNSDLGELIDKLHEVTDIPIAVLTNGTLFYREDVRVECGRADVVVPSLDAGDAAVFEAVNRPARDISIEKLVSGLSTFRDEFAGQIWLEVFIVPGMNTDSEQIRKMRSLIEQMRPDRVQLNTAIRPPAEKDVAPASREMLEDIARQLGDHCEVIADVPAASCDRQARQVTADVLSMLKRRPCSIRDLCTGLGMSAEEAVKEVSDLRREGLVAAEPRGDVVYFRAESTAS
jgi:wyosine [tRNA(Phe)-imidazoG37] synthetase (radical SAM superfamily)